MLMLPVVFTAAQQNIYIVPRVGLRPLSTGQSAHQCPLLRNAPPPICPPSQLANLPTNAYQCPPTRLGAPCRRQNPRDGAPVWPPASPLFNCPPARPPERPTPPPRQLAPHAPLPGARSPAGGPLAPGLGDWGPPVVRGGVGGGGTGGSYCEGHPARATTVRSPAAPTLTQHNAATVTDPQSLSPGPLGPGRFYTNPPTPFGV
ncbi:hypothetical protein N7449_012568 [Penicillium cf. viridicatum]|uniref:Uncharacterized protein n=1 Tax=Penicillium cf. viridicatum TaxID=2972119 RepID=A0A9W9ING3_9EURO|nr:hypothetical protein N7449_012568 [Penicillium cf. viridicatum]